MNEDGVENICKLAYRVSTNSPSLFNLFSFIALTIFLNEFIHFHSFFCKQSITRSTFKAPYNHLQFYLLIIFILFRLLISHWGFFALSSQGQGRKSTHRMSLGRQCWVFSWTSQRRPRPVENGSHWGHCALLFSASARSRLSSAASRPAPTQ